MVDRPELTTAVAKTKNKASVWNDNVNKIMKYCEDSIAEEKSYVDGEIETMTGITNQLSEDVADVKESASYITATVNSCPNTTAGTYTSATGWQYTLLDKNDGNLYVKTGYTTSGNNSFAFYDCGKYWTKKTYNNYDTLLDVECSGEINLEIQYATSTQALYVLLPADIDKASFVGNVSFAWYYSTDVFGGGVINTPIPRNLVPCYVSQKIENASAGDFAAFLIEIPKVSSATKYYCTLVWSAKLNKLEEEEEEEES